jgi:hypothetical protein
MIAPNLQLPTRLYPTEQHFTRYFVKPDSAVRPEDLLTPDYWVHAVERLRPNDRLEIVGTLFEIELRVIRIDTSFLNPRPIFRVLRVWPLDLEITPPELRNLEYRIERAGLKYRAVSPDGRTILTEGFETEADAEGEISRLNSRYEIANAEQRAALAPAAKRKPKPGEAS